MKSEEYYNIITRGLKVNVEWTDKGKGLFAKENLKEGDVIFAERPLVSCQSNDDIGEISVCASCLKSLESVSDNIERVLKDYDHPEVWDQMLQDLRCKPDLMEKPASIKCTNNSCNQVYCTEDCRSTDWDEGHSVVCPITKDSLFHQYNLTQWDVGDVRVDDLFILALKTVSLLLNELRNGKDMDTSWRPFSFLTSTNWVQLITSYPTCGENAEIRVNNLIERAIDMAKMIFKPTDNEVALFEKEFWRSNLLGMISLNSHGFSPRSPFMNYCENHEIDLLDDNENPETSACLQALNNSSSGLALGSLSSCLNHCCEPNASISFQAPDSDNLVVVFAKSDISKGEEILISYTNEGDSRDCQRGWLRDHWRFDCKCKLCITIPPTIP